MSQPRPCIALLRLAFSVADLSGTRLFVGNALAFKAFEDRIPLFAK